MATQSTNFTSATAGPTLFIRAGDEFSYSLSGTFSASMVLEKSSCAGASWDRVLATSSAVSGVLKNEERNAAIFIRWRCAQYTSGTAVGVINTIYENKSDVINNIRAGKTDEFSGPNIIGGPECYVSDDKIHTCVVLGGFSGSANVIGADFTGINGGADDTYTAGTADYSAILGGYDNYCNAIASWIASQHSRIYTAATHASVFGGSNHRISAGDYGAIVGGTLNVISSSGANNAMLGGSAQVISGTSAGCATVGGYGNTLSADYTAAVASYSCTISAASSAALAAQEVAVSAVHAVGMGLQTTSYIQGGMSFGARRHAANGDSQAMSFHESQSTLDGATADLSPYGSANLVSIPINTTWAGTVFVVARQSSSGNRAAWKCEFVASKAGSGNVIIDAQTWTKLFDGITLANPSLNPAGSSVFRVRCAGAAAAGTILWSSRVDVISITG